MLIGARTAAWSGVTWTNPYVTDGLVAMWDGEWNAARGVHSSDATKWRELVSNRFVDISGADISLGDKSVTFNTGSSGVSFSTGVMFMTGKVCTLECLYGTSYHNIGNTQRSVSCAMGVLCTQYAHKTFFAPESNGVNTGYYSSSVGTLNPSTCAIVLRGGGLKSCVYNNGNFVVESYGNNYGSTINYNDDTINIAGSGRCDMTIYSVRVYSRDLTAAEIAANYAVDAARFGLT